MIVKIKNSILTMSRNYSLAFAVMLGFSMISSFVSIHYLSSLESDISEILENDIGGQSDIQKAYVAFLMIEGDIKDIRIFNNPAVTVVSLNKINRNIDLLKTLVDSADPKFTSPTGRGGGRRLLERSRQDVKGFIGLIQGAISRGVVDNGTLDSIDRFEENLKRDFEGLDRIKTNTGLRKFKNIRLQIEFSLFITLVLFVVSIVLRILIYVGNRGKTG